METSNSQTKQEALGSVQEVSNVSPPCVYACVLLGIKLSGSFRLSVYEI